MEYAYARVSTKAQNLDRQIIDLVKEGIKKKAGHRQRKKNNEFIFDRTFTFGQNDSFNKGNKLCTSKKHNSFIKSNNKFEFTLFLQNSNNF